VLLQNSDVMTILVFRVGNYLVMLFLFSKICYIANVISQLFILNKILSAEFNLYGFDIMRDQVHTYSPTSSTMLCICSILIKGIVT